MFIIYKTTNLVNGKYYVGASNGKNKFYIGSGTALKSAVKQYGRKNFVVEVLETFDNEEDMFRREAEIVNESFVADRNTYNMKKGGRGGKGSKKSSAHKKNISKSILKKKELGTLVSNGGRKHKIPVEELIALVEKHGIVGAAKVLNEPYNTFRSRYYSARKKNGTVEKQVYSGDLKSPA